MRFMCDPARAGCRWTYPELVPVDWIDCTDMDDNEFEVFMSTYKLSDVIYEHGEHWVLRVPGGYEVYRTGITHSTRVASIGFPGDVGLGKAVDELHRRERRYHVVAINERTGAVTYCTRSPLTHHEACTMLARFSYHPARRMQLEEIPLDTVK